jgi:hypothetical protein
VLGPFQQVREHLAANADIPVVPSHRGPEFASVSDPWPGARAKAQRADNSAFELGIY